MILRKFLRFSMRKQAKSFKNLLNFSFFFKSLLDSYTIYPILFFYFIAYTEKTPQCTSKRLVHWGVLAVR